MLEPNSTEKPKPLSDEEFKDLLKSMREDHAKWAQVLEKVTDDLDKGAITVEDAQAYSSAAEEITDMFIKMGIIGKDRLDANE